MATIKFSIAMGLLIPLGVQPQPVQSKVDGDTDVTALSARMPQPGLNSGDKRPAEQLTVDLFRRPLTIGGEYQFLPISQRNFSLGNTKGEEGDDYSLFVEHSLSLEWFYELSSSASVFASASTYKGTTFFADGSKVDYWETELDQLWFSWEELFDSDFDITVGKQYFFDSRQWWWDDILDGISLGYWGDAFSFELGVAQSLFSVSNTDDRLAPENRDILIMLGELKWELLDEHEISVFFLVQKDNSSTEREGDIIAVADEDEFDADVYWLGLRAAGQWQTDQGQVDYWLDTAWVQGKETAIDFEDEKSENARVATGLDSVTINGWALDAGLTWQTNLSWRPSITLSYAIGSGDNSADEGSDRSFRQSRLHSNSNRFNGVNYFLYYGELLDPELSNLRIWTLALGIPLFENSSIEVLYHKYDQYKPADFLRNTGIDEWPSGEDKRLGEAFDIVIGLEEWTHWELELIAAFFKAGAAFSPTSHDLASSISLKVNYNF